MARTNKLGHMRRKPNQGIMQLAKNLQDDENMLTLYRKLCRYYYDIDPKVTAGHIRAYRDMWDPKEEKKWKTEAK
jgi:hypothetical protein